MDKTTPEIIVSFTSHPRRIEYVPEVLDSLYQQTRKPDSILLWLAQEQFPGKEKDLPDRIVQDAGEGKLEIRWCDDLGSHKKYFYTMQEYPEDIIITVDDDIHYDPRTVDSLYQSYKKFPNAISTVKASLIIFDKEGKLTPRPEWIISYVALTEEPSLQLMALGSRGILYPPGIHNPNNYSLEIIKQYCCYGDTIFHNDSWLKIHELNAGIPVVCIGVKLHSTQIVGTRATSLRNNEKRAAKLLEQQYRMWVDLAENLDAIKESPNFIASKEEATLNNIVPRLRSSLGEGGFCESVSERRDAIHYCLLEINRLIAWGISRDSLLVYIEECRGFINELPDVGFLKSTSVAISALTDYGAVLRTKLIGSMFNSKECYIQMLESWRLFLKVHSDCEPVYRDGYETFLKNTEVAIKEAKPTLSAAEIREWKLAYKNAIKDLQKSPIEGKPRKSIIERIRKAFGNWYK